MSYLVLARKWRPQSFADVVSQKHVIQALQNAIRLGRLPHALLLTGSRGIGKTTIARIVAKTVNCQNLDPDAELPNPCNQCTSCEEITAGRSVDVTEIDGASNRSIDDIRELRENVQYLPTHSRRKVYIIDEVHMLTREAFNALLKTLEEPPDHVLFLFATTEPHKIPITILSRCQRFDFKRITGVEQLDYLRHLSELEGVTISDTSLRLVVRAADGGMRDALSLLDQVIAFGGKSPSDEDVAQAIGAIDRTILHDIGAALLNRDIDVCLQRIDQLLSHAYDLRHLTQELANFLRDLMVVSVCSNPSEVTDLSAEELEVFRKMTEGQSPDRIQQMFRILTRAAEDIARASYPRLLLEMTLIQMAHVEPVFAFDDVIKQLYALEQRLVQQIPESTPPRGSGGGPSGASGTGTVLPPGGGHTGGGSQAASVGGGSMQQVAVSAPVMATRPSVEPRPPSPQIQAPPSSAPVNGFAAVAKPASAPSFSMQESAPPPKKPLQEEAEDSFLPASLAEIAKRAPQEDNSFAPSSAPVTRSDTAKVETLATNSATQPGESFSLGGFSSAKEERGNKLSNDMIAAVLEGRPSAHEAGAPLTGERWRELVNAYREQSPFVCESLQFARYAIGKNGVVRLIFPANDGLRFDRLREASARQAFEEFCAEQGVALQLDVSLHDVDELPEGYDFSLWERQIAENAKRFQEIRLEAETHPVIQSILDKIPGTEILKVEPYAEGASQNKQE